MEIWKDGLKTGMLEWWNTGTVEGWERNLDHPGKAFFLKLIIPSFRSKVERPRVQRGKAHHSNMPTFQHSRRLAKHRTPLIIAIGFILTHKEGFL